MRISVSEGTGVRVSSVVPKSPAAAAGLVGGSVLRKMDGAEITDVRHFVRLMNATKPGHAAKFELTGPKGNAKTLEIKLGRR